MLFKAYSHREVQMYCAAWCFKISSAKVIIVVSIDLAGEMRPWSEHRGASQWWSAYTVIILKAQCIKEQQGASRLRNIN